MSDPITYSTITPRLGLPMLFAGQSQKETTVNEALWQIDMLVGGAIEGELSSPPALPLAGQAWLVGSSPTGAFADHEGDLAAWTDGGWRFISPAPGLRVHDRTTEAMRFYDGVWRIGTSPALPTGGSVIDTEARATIAALVQLLAEIGIISAT